MTQRGQQPSGHGHGAADVFRDERFAAILETEGELAAGLTAQAAALCEDLLDVGGRHDVLRVVDVGCGPGVATSSLAQRFGSAIVVGVDGSPVMLARAEDRAARQGLSDRVQLRALDLDGDLGSLGSFDLVWAALALHHAQDELAVLGRFAALLRPGGLLCLLERAEPIAMRPAHDLGRPGIWERVQSAQAKWYEHARRSLPGVTNVESYADMLEQVGLELLDTRTLTDAVTAPVDPSLRQLIDRHVSAVLRDLRDALDPADVEALRAAESVAAAEWGDLLVTSTRTSFIARRIGSHP